MQTIAHLLRTHREDIIRAWESTVLADVAIPNAKFLTEPMLRDHVPALLDMLVDVIEHDTELDEAHVGRRLARSFVPHAHALERYESGYSLAATLQEFAHLRQKIVAVLWHARGDELNPHGVAIIHAAIDECMAISAGDMEIAVAGERERFIAVLGHDLRGPLNSIKMSAALLDRVPLRAEFATLPKTALRAVNRMDGLIRDLLDFSVARAGSLQIERVPCDFTRVCAEMIDELRVGNPERLITFDAVASALVLGDGARLAQVVGNLVSNALKYSPDGTPVSVTLRTGNPVSLVVHNDGAPIPKSEHDRVFAPFKRGARHEGEGIGLGLFIAREIVRVHDGTIQLRSEDGEGTTFTVRLPTHSP